MRLASVLLPSGFAAALLLLAHCGGSSGTPSSGDAGAPVVYDAAVLEDAGDDAGTSAVPEASAPSCVLPPSGLAADESCAACLQSTCCQAIVTCFDDPACVVVNSCLSSCFDGVASDGGLAACEAQCSAGASGASSATSAAVAAELACFTGPCSTECPGPPTCGTPIGSYAQSCTSCQISGGTLTCECATDVDASVVTSLDLCACGQPPAVANTDGALTCGTPDGGTSG